MRLAALWLAMLLACGAARAQSRGHLCGTVRDVTESGVYQAMVTAWNQEDGLRRTTETGADGAYRIESLPAGMYKVMVRRPGFQTQVRLDVEVRPEGNECLDSRLHVGSIHEVITIHGNPPVMNTQDGSVSISVDRELLRHLPSSDRGVLGVVELAPGAITTPATMGEAGQFSVSGQRQNANYVEVDGVSANSGVSGAGLAAQFSGGTLPMMTAFGSTHTLASLDEVDEVRLQTSSFAPEFGRMPGAFISVWTRPGTDEFHGAASLGMRNSALDANDWFANSAGLARPASRLWDGELSLGGPVIRQRTFFFASYERMRMDEPYTLSAAVPSRASRNAAPSVYQPLLEAFSPPNGPDLGGGLSGLSAAYARPAGLDLGGLRIDHSFSSRVTAFGRYRQTRSSADSGYAQIEATDFSTTSATFGMTLLASPSAVNDSRLHVSRAAVSSNWVSAQGSAPPLDLGRLFGLTPLPGGAAMYGFGIGGVGGIFSGSSSPLRQGQFEISDNFSWTRGTHALRMGLDYERLTPARDTTATITAGGFWNLADLLGGKPPTMDSVQALEASSLIETLSAFAQDTWRVRPRLTLTFGLRWELTPPPALRSGSAVSAVSYPSIPPGTAGGTPITPPAAFDYASSNPLWSTRYTQFAPRVGAAWTLGHDTVLRTAWGIFYDVAFSVATDPVNGIPFNRWQFGVISPGAPPTTPVGSPSPAPPGASYAPQLHLPYAQEWNVSLEHQFRPGRLLSVSYVGSLGRDELRREGTAAPGSRLVQSVVATNNGRSNYQAAQVQFRQNFTGSLHALMSYAYAHSIDNGSWDNAVYYSAGPGTADGDRGSSSFDVRHNFTAALDWAIPAANRWTKGWNLAAILRARSGFPVDVLSSENLLGLSFDDAPRPDLVAGAPVWLSDTNAPGGRRLNPAAFVVHTGSLQGNLGRNSIRGFGFSQVDLSVFREFAMGEARRLELRLDAYNALNRPAFGDPVSYLSNPLFGVPVTSLNALLGMGSPHSGLAPSLQIGGPRSLQMTVRLRF